MNIKTTRHIALLIVVVLFPSAVSGQTIQWIRELGVGPYTSSSGVAVDDMSNIFITGSGSAGNTDAFISKYNASGRRQWVQRLGTSSRDSGSGISTDNLGNVYITGQTKGSLGAANAGEYDVFLAKYSVDGDLQWTQQLGTSYIEYGEGVSADGLGNVYITGSVRFGSLDGTNAGEWDAFVSKYDSAGSLQWTRQLGSSQEDRSRGISADGLGNVYITGYTEGNLDGGNAGFNDAFVTKYNDTGTLLWTRQLGSASSEKSNGVATDSLGNVYISGWTIGSLDGESRGGFDAFVTKYDADGNLKWTQQLGTNNTEYSNSVSTDGLGNVYIAGHTNSVLGDTYGGDWDAFVSKYDTSGNLMWTTQFGTSLNEQSHSVSADGLGNVYFSGFIQEVNGVSDAFVAKIAPPVPEPSGIVLVMLTVVGLLPRRRWLR